ncbi:hypothetical protein pb186bvf_017198 [Paramecium bursaria]
MQAIILEQKSLQAEIQQLEALKNDKKEMLARIKCENTYRIEKIEWLKTSKRKLKIEQSHFKSAKVSKDVSKKQTKQQTQKSNFAGRLEKLLTQYKLTTYLTSFLDSYNTSLDKGFRQKQQSSFINPFPTINMKPKIQSIQGVTATFRLDMLTKFSDLKRVAFHYWGLQVLLVNDERTVDEAQELLQVTDENGSFLKMDELIIEFYQSKGIINTSQITLLLADGSLNKSNMSNLQLDGIKISGQSKGAINNFQSIKVNKSRIRKVNFYSVFFSKFPGIGSYISQFQIEKEEDHKNKLLLDQIMTKKKTAEDEHEKSYQIDELNCLVFTVLMILLILSIIGLNVYVSSRRAQSSIEYMNKMFSLTVGQPINIFSIEEFWNYLTQVLGAYLFNSDKGLSIFRSNNELVGTLQIRQLRQYLYQCNRVVNEYQNMSCYDPFYINGQENYDTYHNYTYRTAEQLGYGVDMKGQLSQYSDGGFVIDFDRDFSAEDFKAEINQIKLSNYIDEFTSALMVHFSSINPNSNVWITGNLLFERNQANQLISQIPKLDVFIPNIYFQNIQYIWLDIFRLTFAVIIIVFFIYRFIFIWRQENRISKSLQYSFLEVGLFNWMIGVTTILGVAAAIIQSRFGFDCQSLVNSNKPVNLQYTALLYDYQRGLTSISILILLLRLSYFLKLNSRVQVLFQTFYKGFKELFAFLCIQVPLFVGFVFVFQVLFADYFTQYTSFDLAMGSLLRLSLGRFSISDFSKQQPIISIVAITTFYFYYFFFVLAQFQAILIQSFRNVIMHQGYPQDEGFNATPKDLVDWMFSWTVLFKKKPDSYEILKTSDRNTEQLQL